MKQLFYALAVIIVMIIVFRLMKKVESIPEEKRKKSPQEWREDIAALERENKPDDESEKYDECEEKANDETEE